MLGTIGIILNTAINNPSQVFFNKSISSDSPSSTIPFLRAGNLIIIKAKVDTIEGGFILDTGAPRLALNRIYFNHYPASRNGQDNEEGITGHILPACSTTVSQLSFGGIQYNNLEADQVNLAKIEKSKGIKIFGLLGLQLFRQFEMIIDYGQNLIHLRLINGSERNILSVNNTQLSDTSRYTTTSIEIREDRLLIPGKVGGKKLTFMIDTGAESNIINSPLHNIISENIAITSYVTLIGIGDRKIKALYGYMKNMKIGNHDISTLPVLVTKLKNIGLYCNTWIDGMLGFDFLSLQKIGFNFVTGKMYLWK